MFLQPVGALSVNLDRSLHLDPINSFDIRPTQIFVSRVLLLLCYLNNTGSQTPLKNHAIPAGRAPGSAPLPSSRWLSGPHGQRVFLDSDVQLVRSKGVGDSFGKSLLVFLQITWQNWALRSESRSPGDHRCGESELSGDHPLLEARTSHANASPTAGKSLFPHSSIECPCLCTYLGSPPHH